MNNRIIKFRLWNKNAKDFVSGVQDATDHFDLIKLSIYLRSARIFCLDDFVVQQFTGLFDKNNVPIYEGDILKYEYTQAECSSFAMQESSLKFDDLYVVEYRDGAFRYKELKYGDISEDCFTMKVIGNIFQNQDLLK